MTSYLDDVIGVVRTQEDGVVALAAGGDAGALIGLRKHDVKSVCVDAPRLVIDRLATEFLGAHIGNDAVSEALMRCITSSQRWSGLLGGTRRATRISPSR